MIVCFCLFFSRWTPSVEKCKKNGECGAGGLSSHSIVEVSLLQHLTSHWFEEEKELERGERREGRRRRRRREVEEW